MMMDGARVVDEVRVEYRWIGEKANDSSGQQLLPNTNKITTSARICREEACVIIITFNENGDSGVNLLSLYLRDRPLIV